jgi:hypothetical protein
MERSSLEALGFDQFSFHLEIVSSYLFTRWKMIFMKLKGFFLSPMYNVKSYSHQTLAPLLLEWADIFE